MKTKVLIIQIGKVYNPETKQSLNVIIQAFQKTSRDKKTVYYEARMPIFVAEIEVKDKNNKEPVEI